jgi:uncharacterized membrane protein
MAFWIVWNLIRGIPHFDPTFVILAMAASVEAIFLSTFVLISQDRAQAATDKRDDLDLQHSRRARTDATDRDGLCNRSKARNPHWRGPKLC